MSHLKSILYFTTIFKKQSKKSFNKNKNITKKIFRNLEINSKFHKRTTIMFDDNFILFRNENDFSQSRK